MPGRCVERTYRVEYHPTMGGLFDGTPLERPVSCERCGMALAKCRCPRSADGRVLLPRDQSVRVSRKRLGGGRVITIISGLDPHATDLPAILKQFKTSLGSGGTISDGCIELQGDHRDHLVEVLRQQGYEAKASGG